MAALIRIHRALEMSISFVTGYGHLGKPLLVGLVLAGRADRGRRIDERFSALDEMTGQRENIRSRIREVLAA